MNTSGQKYVARRRARHHNAKPIVLPRNMQHFARQYAAYWGPKCRVLHKWGYPIRPISHISHIVTLKPHYQSFLLFYSFVTVK